MKRQLLVISVFTWLWLLSAPVLAQQEVVTPGEPKFFDRPINGGGEADDSTFASFGFDTSQNRVEAVASIVGGAKMSHSGKAFVYNDFIISGDKPRSLSAQISVAARWNGFLAAGGVGGTKGAVEINLILIDLTAGGKEVATAEVHSKEVGGSIFSGDVDFDDSGSRQVSFQANVIRGHRYRLQFQIECTAKTGLIAGTSTCSFTSVVTPGRFAKWTQLSIHVADDIIGLIEELHAKVDLANSSLTTLQTRVNTIDNKVDAANNKLDARLDVAVSTRASQASVNTLTGKVDDLAAALEAFKKLSLRAEIEAALIEGDRYNVALYQVPAAAGGYLELVRSIVADSVESCRKSGLNAFALGQAQGAMASGDQYFAAKDYKDAYDQYRTAYLHLSIVPGDHRP